MDKRITKAMLLAAGLGTRLRPLTEHVPKPMLPLRGRPLIDYALEHLARTGVTEVVINLHHLAEQIESHVADGARYGLHVHYSFEPDILGTGGGIKKCEAFFRDGPFLIMNADTLIDLDLTTLMAHHFSQAGKGTLVVRPLQVDDTYNPLTVSVDGWLTRFGEGDLFYAGVQVATQTLLDVLPSDGPSCLIRDGIEPLLAQGTKFATFPHAGQWNDVGTPKRYTLAQRQEW